ncbi:2Fe-2S iron-sulfur cluster-binding protein [Rhodococcus sp. T7]|uniref:2Fe-2S iron-sulfur cluster-binding protein n=1 Tax=Rhodococcus sp. T7 TaxID=627444 RepID=UPI00135CBBB9|nr:2Fe-2S iron-sulfur cluster-binding protein [Rhodococcus sp. T7]
MNTPNGGARTVTIRPDGVSIVVLERETIVDALRRQGLRIRYKCRRGGCGACRAALVEGHVAYPTPVSDTVVNGPRPQPETRSCLPCRATPLTDVIIELGPRDRIVNVLTGIGAALPHLDTERRSTATHPTRKGPTCP